MYRRVGKRESYQESYRRIVTALPQLRSPMILG